ncbi:MAG: hypothetical protein SPI03_01435 [Campylobacter sputorum]|uniref:DUF7768 domain-containing protein n=1 Tax=Campylobacter sputorum TaxID=206 RepID=UPI002A91936F|nr:hypothetical protein [Campylobacter sputorum]MDY6119993.1 hypothetical protein [Campylobacter sputorum]
MKRRTARLCFVSSPYGAINCKERDRNYYAKKLAVEACDIVRKNGYEPISPVLAWMDLYSELERERVMKNCLELLGVCSFYYFHNCEWSKNSSGMKEELEYARELGVAELKFSLFE